MEQLTESHDNERVNSLLSMDSSIEAYLEAWESLSDKERKELMINNARKCFPHIGI